MALDPWNSSNLEQLALKGLTAFYSCQILLHHRYVPQAVRFQVSGFQSVRPCVSVSMCVSICLFNFIFSE